MSLLSAVEVADLLDVISITLGDELSAFSGAGWLISGVSHYKSDTQISVCKFIIKKTRLLRLS